MRFVFALLLLCPLAFAQQPAPNNAAASSTLADQTDVSITVYNGGLALVRDVRKLTLPTGEHELRFMDVAEKIQPETVSLRSTSTPGSVSILEQNYEYDLISPEKLMEKYVGKDVKLVNFNKDIGFQEQDAQLLSNNNGPVYKVGDRIYLGYPGNVVLPQIPANLISKPTLVWTLNNTAAEQTVEASYLTDGIGWKADYVVTLDRAETKMDLAGWVTLNNQSGAQYANAQLKLVAGEVNRAPRAETMERAVMAKGAMMDMAQSAPREEAFGEYHLYTMPRRTTIKENQSKQLSLLTGSGIAVKKEYEYQGQQGYFYSQIPELKDEKIGVFLKFANKEANGLGMPLPAGAMRVYQADASGALQFSGEDAIKHTPKDEDVRIRLGNAFDVVAERVQTDFKVLAQNFNECAFKVTIRNHKDSDIVVNIVEPMTSDWNIIEKSHDFTKRDAQTAVFSLPVPKNGETVLTYRVQIKY